MKNQVVQFGATGVFGLSPVEGFSLISEESESAGFLLAVGGR